MISFALKSATFAVSSLLLFGISESHAGPDTARAEAYFNAISGGNADAIASFYADDAEFHWIGGPLAGKYKGKAKIKGVWEKFSAAAGKLDHEVLQLSESASGKTSTVTARVLFKADSEVPVKFVMVYKDGKITSEVWQVDRSGAVEAKAQPEAGEKPAADAPAQLGGQPQREAANTPAANAPGLEAASAENAPAPAAATPAPVAPAPAVAATPLPEKSPKTDVKSAGETKGKYAADKKDRYGENDDDYGYGKRGYKARKPYYGHGDYYGHRRGYDGYGWYGGYGHGYGGYGRGYYGGY